MKTALSYSISLRMLYAALHSVSYAALYITLLFFIWGSSISLYAEVNEQNTMSKQKPDWETCLQEALDKNPDFQKAQAKIRQLDGQALVLESQLLPKLNARGTSSPVVLNVTGTQLIFSGAMIPILRASHAIRSAARINVQLEALELIWKLRRAFATALLTRKLEELEERKAKIFKQRVKRAPSLFNAGLLTRADVVALEVRSSLAQESFSKARLIHEQALLDLNSVMGIDSNHPLFNKPVEGDFRTGTKLDLNLNEYINYALQNRTDLKALREIKLATDQRIYINLSQQLPALYAEGTLRAEGKLPAPLNRFEEAINPSGSGSRSQDDEDKDTEDIENTRATFGFQIPWRIFDGGATWGRVKSAHAEAVSQKVLLTQTEKAIPWQVTTSYKAFEDLRNMFTELEQKKISGRSLDLAQELFDQGQISQIEMLDAIEEDISYRSERVKVLYSMEVAQAHLDYVTGHSARFLPEVSQKP